MRAFILLAIAISFKAFSAISIVKVPLYLKGKDEAFSGDKLNVLSGPEFSTIDVDYLSDFPIFNSWFHDRYVLTEGGIIFVDDVGFLVQKGLLPYGTSGSIKKLIDSRISEKIVCEKSTFSKEISAKSSSVKFFLANVRAMRSVDKKYIFDKADGFPLSDFSKHIYRVDGNLCYEVKSAEKLSFLSEFDDFLMDGESEKFKGVLFKGKNRLFFWDGGILYYPVNGSNFNDFGKYFFIFGSKETKDAYVFSNKGIWRLLGSAEIKKVKINGVTSVERLFDIPNTRQVGLQFENTILTLNTDMHVVQKLEMPRGCKWPEFVSLSKFGLALFRCSNGIYAIGDASNPLIAKFSSNKL